MRLIGLVVIFARSPQSDVCRRRHAARGDKQSKDFPGGVVFVERIDAMTDERLCSVHTPMRGIEAPVRRSKSFCSGGEVLGMRTLHR